MIQSTLLHQLHSYAELPRKIIVLSQYLVTHTTGAWAHDLNVVYRGNLESNNPKTLVISDSHLPWRIGLLRTSET
uniref:AlNc14C231G9304 protein n=1 Tax=Albugo laibachii Nc14 TaxID=890382 RepID=F0WSG3_9STRA|nr:AlNc14C231G9304 [Albugo laibachii Nc14]|eukprot:CCA24284.1 AlNc14C231G9304 [Albugo laibachii Nc14]